jgi:hypothetical protein
VGVKSSSLIHLAVAKGEPRQLAPAYDVQHFFNRLWQPVKHKAVLSLESLGMRHECADPAHVAKQQPAEIDVKVAAVLMGGQRVGDGVDVGGVDLAAEAQARGRERACDRKLPPRVQQILPETPFEHPCKTYSHEAFALKSIMRESHRKRTATGLQSPK